MKQFQIQANDAEQRLDKFLKKLFSNASMSVIYKLIRKWNIKINKRKKSIEYILQEKDEIRIFISDTDYENYTQKKKVQKQSQQLSKKDIVYEDESLIAINKSANTLVHPWDFQSSDVSLIYQVQDYLWDKYKSMTFSPSLIHRIDKDTSWIVLIAKEKQTLTQLVQDFKTHMNIEKTYHALVFGKMSRKKWTIQKKLLRIENAKKQNKVRVDDKWQTAITHYTCTNEYKFNTGKEMVIVSELIVQIETWRMHQIRVHLSHIGNPIVWDTSYGNKFLNSYASKHFWVQRHMLHAFSLAFKHPKKQKKMKLTAPLKPDYQQFLKLLFQ